MAERTNNLTVIQTQEHQLPEMKLQLFAETPTTPPAQEQAAPPAQQTAPPAEEKKPQTYTQEQVDDMRKQWDEEAKQKADTAATKAAELAKLPDAEKEKRLREEAQTELEKLRGEVAAGKLTEFARKQLDDAKLPADALPFVKGTDEKSTTERVKAFGTMYAAAVQAGVEARFKGAGRSVQIGSGGSLKGSTELGDAILSAMNMQ